MWWSGCNENEWTLINAIVILYTLWQPWFYVQWSRARRIAKELLDQSRDAMIAARRYLARPATRKKLIIALNPTWLMLHRRCLLPQASARAIRESRIIPFVSNNKRTKSEIIHGDTIFATNVSRETAYNRIDIYIFFFSAKNNKERLINFLIWLKRGIETERNVTQKWRCYVQCGKYGSAINISDVAYPMWRYIKFRVSFRRKECVYFITVGFCDLSKNFLSQHGWWLEVRRFVWMTLRGTHKAATKSAFFRYLARYTREIVRRARAIAVARV